MCVCASVVHVVSESQAKSRSVASQASALVRVHNDVDVETILSKDSPFIHNLATNFAGFNCSMYQYSTLIYTQWY